MRLDDLAIIRINGIIPQNQDEFIRYRLELSHPLGYKDQEYNTVYIQVVKDGLCNQSISSRFKNSKQEDGEIPRSIVNWKHLLDVKFTLDSKLINEVSINYYFLTGNKAVERQYDNTILPDEKAGISTVLKITELLLGGTSDPSSYWYSEAKDNNKDSMRVWFSYK
jgi:hypothetical protein